MKTLEEQMACYAAYHQDARNKATHFVGGWSLQLVGHLFEGRRPALVDNVFQIFVAPIFLAAEVFFALGYKPRPRRRIDLSSAARKGPTAPSA